MNPEGPAGLSTEATSVPACGEAFISTKQSESDFVKRLDIASKSRRVPVLLSLATDNPLSAKWMSHTD